MIIPGQIKEKIDARALGADCDNCPLKECNPVKPKINTNAKLIILGEAPGQTEEDEGEFFVGESGRFLDRTLASLNIERDDLHITNALLCRPPGKLTPGNWGKAVNSCKPRLVRELQSVQARSIFGLGARALQTVTSKKKIFSWVGSIHEGIEDFEGYQSLFAVHPAYILRPKGNAFVPNFKIWLGYAWSRANGDEADFKWPRIITEGPFAPWLERLNSEPEISVDIEYAPISGRIRCIGVGTTTLGISIPLSPEGTTSVGDLDALRQLLSNPKVAKIFHNAPSDLRQFKKFGWVVKGKIYDTLRMDAIVAPQRPHNLHLVCAMEFPGAPNWKTEFKVDGDDKGKVLKRFEKAPIEDLLLYNAKDNIMQARLKRRLANRLDNTNNGWALYNNLIECMLTGIEMTAFGVPVNDRKRIDENGKELPSVFEKHRESFKNRRRKAKRELRLIAKEVNKENWETFKLGSIKEIQDLFFNHLGVKPTLYSEDGNPRVNEKVLRKLLISHNQLQAAAARALLRYRKWQKLLKTYVDGLPIEKHRVFVDWKEYGTVTGRWSSSPNLQNIPKPVHKILKNGKKKLVTPGLRDLFCSEKDYVLLEADYSQLELRIIALMAGDKVLIDQYNNNVDVHSVNARAFFGPTVPSEGPTKMQRDISKTAVYAMNYGAIAVTVWESMLLKFPDITLTLVSRIIAIWFRDHKALKTWQDETPKIVKKQGFVEAPLSGRREYFYTGKIDAGKALNFAVQATGADVINKATPLIQKALKKIGATIVMQVHDALVIHVHKSKIAHAKAIVKKYMEQTITINGNSMKLPVDFKWGTNWGHMEELN